MALLRRFTAYRLSFRDGFGIWALTVKNHPDSRITRDRRRLCHYPFILPRFLGMPAGKEGAGEKEEGR